MDNALGETSIPKRIFPVSRSCTGKEPPDQVHFRSAADLTAPPLHGSMINPAFSYTRAVPAAVPQYSSGFGNEDAFGENSRPEHFDSIYI